jgi:hypothetical protein
VGTAFLLADAALGECIELSAVFTRLLTIDGLRIAHAPAEVNVEMHSGRDVALGDVLEWRCAG